MIGTFLWLSDLHLDPYYGSSSAAALSSWTSLCTKNASILQYSYGHVGCDAPWSLVTAMLEDIVSSPTSENIDFILITGDFLRHQTDQLENGITQTQKILMTLSQALKNAFPAIPVVPAIGNNDVFPDYYLDLDTEGPDNVILNISIKGFERLFDLTEELQTFSKGGYYAKNVTETLTILSLNTVMYSINHQPEQVDKFEDPFGQFAWLHSQLQMARNSGRSVYILGHIPPTIGSYRHSQTWHDRYLKLYFATLQDYYFSTQDSSTVVKGHLFGHLHSDEFRLLKPDFMASNDSLIPVYIASSVTPVYGTNPSYRLVQYEASTGELLDYQTFYLNLEQTYGVDTNNDTIDSLCTSDTVPPVWIAEIPSFVRTYGLDDMSAQSLKGLLQKLEEPYDQSKGLWDSFLERQHVHYNDTFIVCNDVCRAEWLCILQVISKEDYVACMGQFNSIRIGNGEMLLIACAIALPIGIFVAVCVDCMCRRQMKRRQFSQIGQTMPADDEDPNRSTRGDIEASSNEYDATDDPRGEMT